MYDAYEQFLERASAALAAGGAQPVLPAALEQRAAAWNDWDQFLWLENPGSAAFYAFTHLGPGGPPQIRDRIDRLTRDLSARGMLDRGILNLVHVVVSPAGLDDRTARELSKLAPSAYHPGLRPSTVVVDLPHRRVYRSGILGKPPGLDLLEEAVRSPGPFDAEQAVRLRQSHADRLAAFYRLMGGRQPVVTYALITVNVVVFIIMRLTGALDSDAALRNFGALDPRLIEHGQWWRLFTPIFLHASEAHILFNMVSLLAIGTLAERLYGSVKFLAIYLGAGLAGSLASFAYALATGNVDILGVGASGAIFGVAGALVTVRFQRSDIIPRQVRERVSSSMIPLVALSLGMAYLIPHVDNSAHVGGLIGGMALSFVFPLTRSVSEVH